MDEKLFAGTRFEGDGRIKLTARKAEYGTHPIFVSRSSARVQILRFLNAGYSNHSAMGGTVWVVTEYCEAKGIAISITYVDGGYYTKKEDKNGR